ncbi:MAG TPA: hypothetical protein VL282_16985 [Tepidisphaeraceae bacterium]|jgi:hypothetical protein|nr:hypothetical protein [Tepidisphaeraceae bacterium]
MSQAAQKTLAAAKKALAQPIDFDKFLERLGPKDKVNVERHVTAMEAESDPGHALLWKRLACALATLAPHSVKLNGQHSAQFYVQDGKYKMQVFAMEDLRDGKITIYCGDASEAARAAGLITGDSDQPKLGNDSAITLEPLDSKSPNPAPFYKDMLGWNRKALRITMPANAKPSEIVAVESLCALSASKWIVSSPAA